MWWGLSKQGWACWGLWNQPRVLWFNTWGVSLWQYSTVTQKVIDYFRNPVFTKSSGWLQRGRDCLIALINPKTWQFSLFYDLVTENWQHPWGAGSVPWCEGLGPCGVLRGGVKAWEPQVGLWGARQCFRGWAVPASWGIFNFYTVKRLVGWLV